MNNKGFTLVELLASFTLIAIVTVLSLTIVKQTRSINANEAYNLMKNNILNNSYNYILECDNNVIDCKNDYTWLNIDNEMITSFTLDKLLKYGYYNDDDLIRSTDNKYIGNCFIITAKKDKNKVLSVSVDDSKC